MKKLIIMLVAAVLFSGCGGSYLTMGDKSQKEVEASITLYGSVIADYQSLIGDLKGELEVLSFIDSSSADRLLKEELIRKYEQKIDRLENERDSFLNLSAGKDKLTNFNLKSDSPSELAQAYWLIRSADSPDSLARNNGDYTGMILNQTNEAAVVKITDPAGRIQEHFVKASSNSVISLSMQGRHYINIVSQKSRQELTIVKEVGSRFNYYLKGERFDLMVTISKK